MPLDRSVAPPPKTASFRYDVRDVILYALGVGAQRDELDYLYEERGPKVLPSFAVVPKLAPMMAMLEAAGGNLDRVVHGSERIESLSPFAPSGELTTTASLGAIYDMKRFASAVLVSESRDESGTLVARSASTIYLLGEGDFGGPSPPPRDDAARVPRGREPDFRVEQTTSPEQALLYRLSGDRNPLHASPEFAQRVGFDKPILHGLATFGFLVRHLARGLCDGDAGRVRVVEGQFRKPVFPGETLVTQGWFTAPGKVALQVSVKERGEVVLGNAWAGISP